MGYGHSEHNMAATMQCAAGVPVSKGNDIRVAGVGIINGLCLVLVFMCFSVSSMAQANKFLLQGNKLYDQQRYKEAAADYSKALAKDPTNTPGMFNLGNSLYQQKLYDSSRKVMASASKVVKDKNGKAAANYNIGNSYMSEQKWEDAVNAYKTTLRNNPQDGDAKYNLSYAEQMLKKQQQEQKKDEKKDKQDKDKDKKNKGDQKNQDQKQEKQDKDGDPKDDKNQKEKEEQEKAKQEQAQPSKLSQQQAEQLLNALQQEEKKLQDKMKKEKGVPTKMTKDW